MSDNSLSFALRNCQNFKENTKMSVPCLEHMLKCSYGSNDIFDKGTRNVSSLKTRSERFYILCLSELLICLRFSYESSRLTLLKYFTCSPGAQR